MKYKILEQNKNNIQLFCLYDDNTFALLDLVAGRELEEILKDAYILSKSQTREAYKGEPIEDLKTYTPTPKETRLDVDFYGLTGKVYDQYGDAMELPITFTIEGTDSAKIEDGKLVEGEVDEKVEYEIVATVGDLVEKQQRMIYPEPVIEEPNPDDAPITRKEYEELKQALEIALGGMADDTTR